MHVLTLSISRFLAASFCGDAFQQSQRAKDAKALWEKAIIAKGGREQIPSVSQVQLTSPMLNEIKLSRNIYIDRLSGERSREAHILKVLLVKISQPSFEQGPPQDTFERYSVAQSPNQPVRIPPRRAA